MSTASTLAPALIVSLVACLGACSAPSSVDGAASATAARWSPAAPYEEIDKYGIWGVIKGPDFDAIEQFLNRHDKAYRQDALLEEPLIQAYKSFQLCNDHGLDLLTQWVKAKPKSPAARTARAYCQFGQGERARGTKWARDTSAEQFRELFRLVDLAVADAREAIKMDPDRLAPYRILVVSGKHLGGDLERAMVQEAIARHPSSFFLWVNHLEAVQPKWGGSVEEMNRVAAAAQQHAAKNPRLRVLLGYPSHILADAAFREGDYEEVLRLESEALRYGDDYFFYSTRAWAFRNLRRWEEARDDITKAKTLFPDQDRGTADEWLERMKEEQPKLAPTAAGAAGRIVS